MPVERSRVWGVYDNRDYYGSVLVENLLYDSREAAEAECDALNETEGGGFSVEGHELDHRGVAKGRLSDAG